MRIAEYLLAIKSADVPRSLARSSRATRKQEGKVMVSSAKEEVQKFVVSIPHSAFHNPHSEIPQSAIDIE